MLYPLKFEPVYKDYIWGGRRLAEMGKVLPEQGIVAESWEISCHPNGVSVISNGPLAGMPLPEATRRFGRDLLGSSLPEKSIRKFPLLVKLIDAADRLSIQVHPDDRFAAVHEPGEAGKNEMWYVVKARSGAALIAGVRPGVGRDGLSAALASGGSVDLFQEVAVQAGDVINIPAGLVHAIGRGLVICEIQQSSDVTYRLYDYGRRDALGNERPLHLEKGLAAIDYRMTGQSTLCGLEVRDAGQPDLCRRVLVLNRYFYAEELAVRGNADFIADGSRFITLTAIKGQGEIQYHGESGGPGGTAARQSVVPLCMGESVLIPAGLGKWRLTGDLKLIASRVSDFAADLVELARLTDLAGMTDLLKITQAWTGQIGFDPLPDHIKGYGGVGGD